MSIIRYEMLRSRDLQTDLQTLPDTFSTWDKCMAKDFCKYPVIVGCIIGGLIFISLLWCIIRCLMCGYACCSCCCGGCGGSRRSQKHQHQVEFVPVQPPIYQPPAYRQEQLQFAYTTDRSGNVSGDSLPAMPTWESTKVEIKEEVEMGYVNNEEYKRKTPSPSHGGYIASPQMVALQQRSLTPASAEVGAYAQRQQHSHTPTPTQRVLSPGPMPAPIPINPSGQKTGFDPRGPTPGPQHQYEYEDRDPIQENYGYQAPQQQGPRWGNQPPPHQRQPYDLPYDNDAPEVVLPPQLQPRHGGQQYVGGNPDYYNTYPPSVTVPQKQSGVGGHAVYQPPRAHGHPPQNAQSMYPVDDRVYDYDDPHRKKQDPWSAL